MKPGICHIKKILPGFLFGCRMVRFSTVLIGGLLVACTPSRDLYKVPPVNRTVTVQPKESASANGSAPEWINAVSKDFYVGTGYGKTVDEARRAALNDIKSFIVSSIGETGSVTEINIVANETTGRSANTATEAYVNKNSFRNKYKPVINISAQNFEDYHWSEGIGKASYYIKYRIDNDYLDKIRQDCINAIEKHEKDKLQLQRRIDSLSNTNDLDAVEDLCRRKEQLLTLFNTVSFPTKHDSMKVVQSVYKIKRVLDNLTFRVTESNNNQVGFVLESGGRQISTTHTPWLSYETDLVLSDVKPNPRGWLFSYELKPWDKTVHPIGINLDFPGFTVSKQVELKNEQLNPEIEISEAVQYVITSYSWWKDKALSGEIRLPIFAEAGLTIERIEIIPVSSAGDDALISFGEQRKIEPGTNFIEWESSKVFPAQFLKSVSECDVTLYYKVNNQFDFKTFNAIPFKTIN
jgi:hypothetical protein